jgi:predicted dehydrogenase
MTLRVGILGAGQVGQRHAIGFSHARAGAVVGYADVVVERAEALAAEYGGDAFADRQRLLDQGLDVLVVGLPHSLHVEPVEEAAARGVHVLMEKPLATTLADARRIVAVCEEHGVKLGTGFVHRYRDEVEAARRWIEDGLIGAPQVVSASMNGQRSPELPAWVTREDVAGGGVLMYNGIHAVDRLRQLVGSEVTEVSAQVRRYDERSELEDSAAALLRFSNGAVATLVANAPAYHAQPSHWDTEIYGARGRLRLRNGEWADVCNNVRSQRVTASSHRTRLGERYNFVRQAEAFLAAIEGDQEPPVTGEDGLRALEVILAIYRSAEEGTPVRVGETDSRAGVA